jgi:hypothetical protein
MEISKTLSAESAYERDLQSIERRLMRIEGRTNLLVGLAGLGLIPLFSRLFVPRLWTYEQYSSRHLRIHKRYLAEPIPKNPPRFERRLGRSMRLLISRSIGIFCCDRSAQVFSSGGSRVFWLAFEYTTIRSRAAW